MSTELVITRVLYAPRELVWKAWTEADQLAQWWGPKGCVIGVTSLDLRPRGLFLYNMTMPDGNVMWGKFVFQEIHAPEQMVFVNSFSDGAGNTTRAPFSPTWPLEVKNTLTLTEMEGKTLMTISGSPIHASVEELSTFAGMISNLEQGFAGTFDQLEEYLQRNA